jgi:hypothetical protein
LIAVLLVLLVAMLPFGGAVCDVHCGAVSPNIQGPLASQACVEHECCHTRHAVLCDSSHAQGVLGMVAASGLQTLGSLTLSVAGTGPLAMATEKSAGGQAADSSPPVSQTARSQTQLRI